MENGLFPKKRRNDVETLDIFIKPTKPNYLEGEKFLYMMAENMYIYSILPFSSNSAI